MNNCPTPWRVGRTAGGALGIWSHGSRTDDPDVCRIAMVPQAEDYLRAELIVSSVNAMRKDAGRILSRVGFILDKEAEVIRKSYTALDGSWPDENERRRHNEYCTFARQLRTMSQELRKQGNGTQHRHKGLRPSLQASA